MNLLGIVNDDENREGSDNNIFACFKVGVGFQVVLSLFRFSWHKFICHSEAFPSLILFSPQLE